MAVDERGNSARTTRQREAVFDVLGYPRKFFSARDIHRILVRKNSDVALATVYRTLKSFSEAGELDVIFNERETLYRRCSSPEHHHHLVCRRCGRSVEIENPDLERWTAEVSREHGFESVGHTLELYGICRKCIAFSS